MNLKGLVNKSRFFFLAGIINLLVMVILIFVAAHIDISLKTNTGSITAAAGMVFDVAVAYLFMTINHFTFLLVFMNVLISGCLVGIAALLSRTHKQLPAVKKLNFSTENR